MIIGISGKKQHGKDTVANIIQYLTFKNNLEKGYKQLVSSDEVSSNIFMKWTDNYKADYSGWQKKQFAGKLKQIVSLLINCTVEQLEDNDFKEKPLGEEWRVYEARGWNFENKIEYNIYANIEDIQRGFQITQDYILTPRKLLQLMGTECGRNIIHPNVWVNALMADYTPYNREYIGHGDHTVIENNWIITDVRFPNEVEAIKKQGGLVFRVNRVIDQMCTCGIPHSKHFNFDKEGNPTSSLYRHIFRPIIDSHPSETALDSYIDWDGVILNEDMKSLIGQVQNYLNYYKII